MKVLALFTALASLAGCASAPVDEPACASLDGMKLVYDLTSLSASTPECRKAIATVDLSSGAFELVVTRQGTAWQVETSGAVYPARVDPARACSVTWNDDAVSAAGTKLHAEGELDRVAGTGSVRYVATAATASCEATLEGRATR